MYIFELIVLPYMSIDMQINHVELRWRLDKALVCFSTDINGRSL